MRLTVFLIALCGIVFFWNSVQHTHGLTFIDQALLYDTIPGWQGIYSWVLLHLTHHDTSVAEGPLFSQILHGQVWRLFSPAILHRDFLHLAFNMLWLWVLGRPIEERLGATRTVVLMLVIAGVSNTAQYLMSGPLFLGYSGVALGLAGFTWAREKLAPWEGYPLQRSTVLFLVVYILALLGLQVASLVFLWLGNIPFSPNIANTAHIAGALTGLWLGRLKFFALRKHEHT